MYNLDALFSFSDKYMRRQAKNRFEKRKKNVKTLNEAIFAYIADFAFRLLGGWQS